MNLCPQCESKGRTIKPVTLEAQVVPARLDQLAEHDGWRLCTSESCEVVYFRDDEVVALGETRGVPFHKSEDPQRLVCFCFEHSVADIEADVAETATSTIQASIKAECKAGRDDCERKNPQGRCCLGNVGQVVKRAAPDDADGDGDGCGGDKAAEAESCCAPKTNASEASSATDETTARSGLLASGGALVAAVLSSAYCWLPLAAIGLGASSAGVGAVAEASPPQTKVRYQVEGMTCAGCEGHAREAIEAIPGVASVAVSYRDGSAEVVWSGQRNDASVADAVAEFGYSAEPLR